MCRIAGFFNKYDNHLDNKKLLIEMRDTLSYGGPDAADLYVDEYISLGHRRLSIIDLSEAGRQPMSWQHYEIIFNGEIYNYKEVQKELIGLGYTFTTGTDTEVILKSFHEWKFDCVQRFRGMFTFAIWDKQEKKLTLCRDRVGVKPLFWYKKDDVFIFASELKAFHKHPDFDKTIDKKAVGLFLQQGYIHSPHCIFKYAYKLHPGSFLEIDTQGNISTHTYWNVEQVHASTTINTKSEGAILEELEDLLLDSFKLRMVADVPVGMFLSGGIDSSLVTALLQKAHNTPLNTFTIGFEDEKRNEAVYAKAVAEHIGTNHTELICTEQDFKGIIGELPYFYDEPFGDSSGIPTFLVSKLARESVTVSLSADGGDELFGGYTKYEISKKIFSKIEQLPKPVRKLLGVSMQTVNPAWLDKYGSKMPFLRNYTEIGHKFSKFKNAVQSENITDFFNASSAYINEKQIGSFIDSYYRRYEHLSNNVKVKPNNVISFLSMLDVKTYLEGDIMAKVDRATMQVALEGREPFLDHKLIEFSQSIPDQYKIKDNQTKYLLRKVLYKYVPKELIERPKQGFSIPIKEWLQVYLKNELLELIEDADFFKYFELNAPLIRQTINHFLENKSYINPHLIWFIYTLHQWYKKWL